MTYLTEILKRAETDRPGALKEMTLGLMRGDPAQLKAGYEPDAAAIAAAECLDATLTEVKKTLAPEATDTGFLRYLVDELAGDVSDVLRAIEKPQDYWQENARYLIARERGEA